jgi:hypothetical protein
MVQIVTEKVRHKHQQGFCEGVEGGQQSCLFDVDLSLLPLQLCECGGPQQPEQPVVRRLCSATAADDTTAAATGAAATRRTAG